MTDLRLQNLARILVHYSVQAQRGDRVSIRCVGSVAAALPLQAEVFREVLRAGAYPHPLVVPHLSDEFNHIFFSEAADHQLQHVSPFRETVAKTFDCDIAVLSETNTRNLSGIDSSRQAMTYSANSEVTRTVLDRASKGEFRWVMTAVPTNAYAQDAEMSQADFEDFVYTATLADTEDPVSGWKAIGEKQKTLVNRLRGKKSILVKGPHAELRFSVEGRTFISCDGHVNMPDGEIFTGPVEDSVNGWFESTYSGIGPGFEVGKVTFRVENGLVVHAQAERNQDQLIKILDTDAGARRLGEFGIGTNDRIKVFTKNMLFDEKIGGTVHFAVGLGYPESGSKNESAIHWDFLCDMKDGGQITADDQLFYDSGKFVV